MIKVLCVSGLPREIAAIIGAPLGTVKSRMFYAAEHLRITLRPLATDYGILPHSPSPPHSPDQASFRGA